MGWKAKKKEIDKWNIIEGELNRIEGGEIRYRRSKADEIEKE